jgi:hypothetical protein
MPGGVKALFSPPKTPKVETPKAPAPDNTAVEEARRKQVEEDARARGRAGTYLTGSNDNSPPAQLQRKTFLGA